jgi:hypothetical protein
MMRDRQLEGTWSSRTYGSCPVICSRPDSTLDRRKRGGVATRLAGLLIFAFAAHWPTAARAGHPLLTEDTGTQGAGHYQLELTHELSHSQDIGTKARAKSINAVLSIGVTETIDAILSLPYEQLTEVTGSTSTSVSGYADLEIAAKWRFYDEGPLSFALRPGLGLPTGNDDQGLSADTVIPSLFGVMTYTSDPWAFNLHIGYTRLLDNGPEERGHIYHASTSFEYSFNESLRVVGDASVESNPEKSGHPNVGSAVIGLVYSLTPDLDFDFGYRKGLTDAAPDHAWLVGLAWRF